MLNGAAVMDAALLLIAGNESCPQPQTSEHLAAIEIMKLKQILILQNKIDLVKESQAKEQYEDITKFVQGTVAEGAPIIPISAQLKYNIDVSRKSSLVKLKKMQSIFDFIYSLEYRQTIFRNMDRLYLKNYNFGRCSDLEIVLCYTIEYWSTFEY